MGKNAEKHHQKIVLTGKNLIKGRLYSQRIEGDVLAVDQLNSELILKNGSKVKIKEAQS
ncbi:hypothetical protein [Serratia fonticola]